MELPDDSPRLPKLPFIVGDLVLLSLAAFLAYRTGAEPTLGEVIGIIVCAGLGVGLGVAPFILDYAREQDRQLREREEMMAALIRSTSAAADQASIAASGLNEIATVTKSNLRALDNLPAQVSAARNEALKVGNIPPPPPPDLGPLQQELTDLRTALAELKSHLDQQGTDLRQHLSTEIAKLPSAPPAPGHEEPPAPKKAKRAKAKPTPPPEEPPTLFDSPPPEPPPVEPPPAPKPKPKRPRKTKAKAPAASPKPTAVPESPGAQPGESDAPSPAKSPPPPVEPATPPTEDLASDEILIPPPTEDIPHTPEEAPPPPDALEASPVETPDAAPPAEPSPVEPEPAAEVIDEPAPEEPALSADGTTRLTATAYIGIGNRLFIRGDGPGLNPDEGIPLQFVSIGKWRWETDAATAPVKVTLWKNDEELCTSLGEIELKPGEQRETAANF